MPTKLKIEELFSELDKDIESLESAREQLKVYRQAVLKHAFEGKLTAHTPCIDMPEDRLVEAIAVVHIELILIHPFREGNGRLSRLLANVMALQAGWPELDFTAWDEHKDDYFAAIQAGLSDYEPMKRLVRRVLFESATERGRLSFFSIT